LGEKEKRLQPPINVASQVCALLCIIKILQAASRK